MRPDGLSRALLDKVRHAKEVAKLVDPHTPTPDWLLEELSSVWREAQREAEAYDHWRRSRGSKSYVRYRATQDRADAAQDALQVAFAAGGA